VAVVAYLVRKAYERSHFFVTMNVERACSTALDQPCGDQASVIADGVSFQLRTVIDEVARDPGPGVAG
jgi:hypothetical protein